MRPQSPLEFPANPFQGRARTLVARIRVKAHPQHLPRFERVRQHEQLCLSVSRSANRRARQPRVANLTGVRKLSPMPGVPRRPRPSLEIPEARRPNDRTIVRPNNRKRRRAPSISPGQSGLNIIGSGCLTLRNGTPLIQRRVTCRGSNQSLDVSTVQRFQTNLAPRQRKNFSFHLATLILRPHIGP